MKSILNKFAAVAMVRFGVALVCAGIATAGLAAHLALRNIDQSCDAMMQYLQQPSELYLRSLGREKAASNPVSRAETAVTSGSTQTVFQPAQAEGRSFMPGIFV